MNHQEQFIAVCSVCGTPRSEGCSCGAHAVTQNGWRPDRLREKLAAAEARIAELEAALDERNELRARIAVLKAALALALAGWHEASLYKTEFLREKHGDEVLIARLRALVRPDGPAGKEGDQA